MSAVNVAFRLSLAVNVVFCTLGIFRVCLLHLSVDDADHDVTVDVTTHRRAQVSSNDSASGYIVPNIVHYIWYNMEPRPLQFQHMLSVMSAHKILQPDVIYFHTNIPPVGPYWQRVLKLPKLEVNYREPPITLYGQKIKEPFYYTSHSNVDRVKVLMEYGGIYLDLDVLVTRPFDELRRQFACTIGREQETKACGSVIICSRHSPFLLLWINSYIDDYRIEEWAYNTGQVPFNLARRFPHLVHMDEDRINRPNFDELELIWGAGRFNWRRNYAVHLWYRLWKDRSPYFHGTEPDDDNVKSWNSTFGEMARSILYGSPQLIHAPVL